MALAESAEYLGLSEDEMPPGWRLVRLGDDLVEDVQPGFACGINTREVSGVPHLRPMNVSREGLIELADLKFVPAAEVRRDQRWLGRGDVLFNNTNSAELVGKTAFYGDPEPRAFSNHMTRVRCRTEALDPRFCAKALHYLWQTGYFESMCSHHVSQASVGRAALLDTAIPLPPVSEQRRIVAKIDELLARVNAAREHLARVSAILKRLRRSVLAAACSGRLSKDWRQHHRSVAPAALVLEQITHDRKRRDLASATRAIKDEDIAIPKIELPATWSWCRVGQIADVRLGGTPSRKEPRYWGGDIPWVSSGEVANCRVTSTTEHLTRTGLENSNAKLYPRGTVLIAMIGEGKTRGQAAILDIDAATNQNAAGLVFDAGHVEGEYVWIWALDQYESNREIGRGGSQPALNGAKVRALPVPLPPLEEQSEILRRVWALFAFADTIEQRVATATARASRLTQSILAKAFRGELVPTGAQLRRAGVD